METQQQHTPTPYRARGRWIVTDDGRAIAECFTAHNRCRRCQERREADAEYICRACNAHDALVAVCSDILWGDCTTEELHRAARAALAAAKGEKTCTAATNANAP